jgi:hypothetical protein
MSLPVPVLPASVLTTTTPWETFVEAYLDAAIDSPHTRRAYARHLHHAFAVLAVATLSSGGRSVGYGEGHNLAVRQDGAQLVLAVVDVVGRAFSGFMLRREHGDGAAGGLGREEHPEIEAEGPERQCPFGRDDLRVQ